MLIQHTLNIHSKISKNSLPMNNSIGTQNQSARALTSDVFFGCLGSPSVHKYMNEKTVRRQAKIRDTMENAGWLRRKLIKKFNSHEELMEFQWYRDEQEAKKKKIPEN